jgi:predicted  nucleic acid-binding Zn-ribbon protein
MKTSATNIDKTMLDAMTTLFCLFACLFAVTVMQSRAQKNETPPNPIFLGDITVTAEWDPDTDIDLDLWVQGPLDDKPVGYSRTTDHQTSFMRDDVGASNDFTNLNYEIETIRGLKPGRYVVNIHFFRARQILNPHVKVVAVLTPKGSVPLKLASREFVMTHEGEEVTAFSFALDNDGDLIEGSVSDAFIPLRNQEPKYQ